MEVLKRHGVSESVWHRIFKPIGKTSGDCQNTGFMLAQSRNRSGEERDSDRDLRGAE